MPQIGQTSPKWDLFDLQTSLLDNTSLKATQKHETMSDGRLETTGATLTVFVLHLLLGARTETTTKIKPHNFRPLTVIETVL